MEIKIFEIPTSWQWTISSDVCSSVRDGTHDTPNYVENGIALVTSKNLINGTIDFSNTRNISLKDHKEISRRSAVDSGDILFAMIGTIGNPVVVSKSIEFSIKNVGLFKNNNSFLSSKYLRYWLDSLVFHNWLKPKLKGSTQKFAPLGLLRTLPFPLPPTNEQHRIVAKIEALFSELDKGIESFKTAREQLKVYRQALLKQAFSGKLTEQWRAENAAKLESAEILLQRIQNEREQRYQQQLKDWEANGKQGSKPKAPKTLLPLTAEELVELPQLPVGWGWTRLEELSENVTDGDHQAPPQTKTGIPFITISDIKNQQIDFSDTRHVSVAYFNSLSKSRKPVNGDILYTVTGSFGIPCLINFEREFCFQRHIGLIRPCKLISTKYLFYCLASQHVYNQATSVATGTAQKTVPLGGLRLFKIPLASIQEQEKIVNLLEQSISQIDQLDQTITTALQQAEALRQSILKKAFSGQLVPQDPNDEPASVLLERIQAEKTKPNKQSTSRRAKKQ